MAYHGEVRIDTRLDNKGIVMGVRNAAREIAKLSKAFESTIASVRKQEIALSDLQRKYDALMEGQKTPASLSAMQTSLRNTEREIREVEKANKNLFAQYESAAQKAEALRPFGETDEQFIKAQEQADILFRRLEPVEQKFAELNAKAQDLRQSIAGVKMTPETSAEAQLLADKIQLAKEHLEQGQSKAAGLEQGIASATAEAERLQNALDEAGGAQNAKAALDSISRAAQTAAKVSTSAFKTIAGMIGGIAIGATRAAKGIFGMAKNILTLGKNSKKATGGVGGLGKRLLQLGAAAFVFNVLRKGLRQLSEDMRNVLMANQEFATAWNAIKVNMLTAFAPLWEVLEPAIVRFMQLLAQFTAVLARFMALLFGKTYTQARESAKALNDQAKAIKGVGDAATKASAPFDEFNDISSSAGGGGGADGLDFDFPEPQPSDFSWLDDILNVFKSAWDNVGQYVIDGWKNALNEVLGLAKKIGKTFLEVWTDGHGQRFLESLLTLFGTIGYIIGDIAHAFSKAWDIAGYDLVTSLFDMFVNILDLLNTIGVSFRKAWNDGTGVSIATHILRIFTNINNIIGGFAARLREAWETNNNGVKIWSAVLGIVESVLGFFNRITKATAEWVNNLNLEPLVGGFAKLLEAIKPVVDILLDGLAWAWENVILPFGKWLLELVVPAALDALAKAFDAIKVALDAVKPAATWIWENFLVPLGEWTGEKFLAALDFIGKKFDDVTKWISENSDDINAALEGIGKVAKLIWENALKPVLDTVWNVFKGVVDSVGTILGGLITFLAGVFTGDWEKAWGGIKEIFKGIFNGIVAILEGAINLIVKGINGLFGTLNSISIDMPDWVEKKFGIGSIDFNIPRLPEIQIPRLARGGIVDSATIAMIGEKGREAVVPLSQNAEWMKPMQDLQNEFIEVKVLLRQLIEIQMYGNGTLEGILAKPALSDADIAQANTRGNFNHGPQLSGNPLFSY